MINRETDYAVRAVMGLSQKDYASASELAAAMDIPYRFLRTVVRKLVAAKLVRSRRGKGGGLSLARPARRISLLDVLRAMAPLCLMMNRCLASRAFCRRSGHCAVHARLAILQRQLDARLKSIHFGRLAEASRPWPKRRGKT
jgi:Rrf2 family protein